MTDDSALEITITSDYIAENSDPLHNEYQFAYTITLHNQSAEPLQLLARYWLITDGNQKVIEVEGEGVVGKQPRLAAGEIYQYTSGVLFATPIGTMQGYYLMERQDGSRFKAPIPLFRLAVKNALH